MRFHLVTLLPRGRTLRVREGTSILEAADAEGIALPAGCRFGACRTCAAELVEGKVAFPGGTGLTESMMDEGLVLPCVTTPRSDCTLRVGGDETPLLPPDRLKPWTE